MRIGWLGAVLLGAGCTNDTQVEIVVTASQVRIHIDYDINYFPLVEDGCDDPGDSYDSSRGEPACPVEYRLSTDNGVSTAGARGSYTFDMAGLGGTLEMSGCGVRRTFSLPGAVPTVTDAVATREGDQTTIDFEAPRDTATHYSASRQNGVFGYLTCTVRGDQRSIIMTTRGSQAGARISLVGLVHHESGGVVIEAQSEPLSITQPTE